MAHPDESWRLAAKQAALRRRAAMIQIIRRFFCERDYLEVETPIRIPAPAPEEHIEAFASGDRFLQTSPELCMKRLVAAGYPRVFQIGKCFRQQERGRLHLPEFTMLEWYRSGAVCEDIMQECEKLLLYTVSLLDGTDFVRYQGVKIELQPPWERIPVAEAFARYAPVTMQEALEKDCFDEVMALVIEPRLKGNHPVFMYDFPIERGALARAKAADPMLAERFELYTGGLELANAFCELTDAGEQRRRFEKAQHLRRAAGKQEYPLPETFLSCLSRMPETSGIALGIDRLAMLFNDIAQIDEVVAFTPEEL